MVELQNPIRTSLSIFENDLTFLDNINNNRSEALRYVCKEYRRMKTQEKSVKPILMLIIGVLIITIAYSLPFGWLGLFLWTLGFSFLLMNIVQAIKWLIKRKGDRKI